MHILTLIAMFCIGSYLELFIEIKIGFENCEGLSSTRDNLFVCIVLDEITLDGLFLAPRLA